MIPQRVAIIFDNQTRPETTGFYCRRALAKLTNVEHFLPGELATLSDKEFDLYLRIDDGLDYPLPSYCRPALWWAIDTHLQLEQTRSRAAEFDRIYVAQKDGAESLQPHFDLPVEWLPLAADPEIHRPYPVEKQFDWCFVGNLFEGPRAELVQRLQQTFPRTFVGNKYFEEMAQTYSASQLIFNRSLRNDVNMRVFEALSCGGLLLTNDLTDNGQAELFQDGVHLATYQDCEELIDKAAFYLQRQSLCQSIGQRGREAILAHHTYEHRMQTLLAAAEQLCSSTQVSVPTSIARPTKHTPKKDSSYFQHTRPEILEKIPPSARRVLDIGCGSGRLGAALKARQPVTVLGMEREASAAAQAREVLDEVIEGDVEQLNITIPEQSLDAVICGDILEHLREPERLLRQVQGWLKQDGLLIASIPNVRHHSVIRSLLAGNWTYESAGLLDQDHVRFFTRREIEKLCYRCGFELTTLESLFGPGDQQQSPSSGVVDLGNVQLHGLGQEDAQEFYTYQYLLTGTPRSSSAYGLTSIVIVTYNQWEYTRLCVESIQAKTDQPYEFIFVDNASSDGTPQYLQQLPNAQVILNPENRGFPAAVNQGIALASGEHILLLNNDTIVTTGWLDRLLEAMHRDFQVGLVGPCSNQVSGRQCIEAQYDSLSDLDGFAWDWTRAHRGQWEETDRLIGFCLLIRRAVIDQIGHFDERFGIGCFEDDDYTRRAREAGYRTMIAWDSFVHHFGGRTFLGSGVDFAALMQKNQQLYEEKWSSGTQPGQSQEPTNHPVQVNPTTATASFRFSVTDGGLRLIPETIRLSLCMIVRDNENTIGEALQSIRPWVDEMVVVDTGSKDRTPEIVQSFGARLFHFPWCDSFAEARNVSLEHARGEWIFWMDSDDTISEDNGRQLRALLDQPRSASTFGYVVSVHCPSSDQQDPEGYTRVTHVKLFPNRPDLRFEHRIHEQILPAILRAGGQVEHTELFVTHSGYDNSPEGQKRKLARDLRLLTLELDEQPDHPFALFNLGMTYTHEHRYTEALPYLKRCLEVSVPKSSHLRKAYAFLYLCYKHTGNADNAWEVCQQGLEQFPLDAELRFYQAQWLQEAGRLAEAEQGYQDILARLESQHYTSVNQGISGHLTRHNLAVVYQSQGKFTEAESQWRWITQHQPRYRLGWYGLGECLLLLGKTESLRQLAQGLLDQPQLAVVGKLLLSDLARTTHNTKQARELLEQAHREAPEDLEVLERWCRFLFEEGTPQEAKPALQQLLQYDPDNAAGWHNLGTVYLQLNNPSEAIEAYQRSLKVRPKSAITWSQLGQAFQAIGEVQQANAALQKAQQYQSDPKQSAVSW